MIYRISSYRENDIFCLHTAGVTGSKPVSPTIKTDLPLRSNPVHPFSLTCSTQNSLPQALSPRMNACSISFFKLKQQQLKKFRYRLYPTSKQEALLNRQFEECRWLYNHFLEHRKNAWDWYGVSLSHYGQQNKLPSLKRERPSLDTVYSQTLRNVAVRIDRALQAFFRRIKSGEDPGYPHHNASLNIFRLGLSSRG